jgi:hypothetical protein
MIGVMKTDLCPKVNISKHCSDPYDCPLQDLCWGFLPSSSVFDLYRGGVKCFKLLDEGVTALKDIPHGYKLSDKQGIQHQCEIENEVHVDVENLRKFLNRLDGTVNYLDFETFMTAVPLLDGVRPYQMVPFQWSLHVDGSHYEFLGDSREEFLASLKKVIGPGPVVVYNQSFEIGRLRELALEFPAYKEWVEDVISRVVDLYEVFKNFYYYNPKQKGSASLKAVVPAVLGRDPYADLGINKGGMALISYLKMMKGGKDCRAELLAYCKMDTEAMVWVVEEMRNLIEVG